MDYKELTACCGIDCFNCEVYEDNITDEMRSRMAALLHRDPEGLGCRGCRASGCLLLQGPCATKACVQAKGLALCSECPSFPCGRLMPSSDRAATLPHNLKVYNLCRIKALGIDAWAGEAAENRRIYYKGKMHIGAGPWVEEESGE